MCRPEERTDGDKQVAIGEGAEASSTEKPCAEERQHDRGPKEPARRTPDHSPLDERGEDHVQGGEKAGVRDRGQSPIRSAAGWPR